MKGENAMRARASRTWLSVMCLGLTVLLAACERSGSPTPPPAASGTSLSQPQADLDLTPIVRDFLARLPEGSYEVPAAEMAASKPFVVDVRQPEDYARGFVAGAVNIPLRELTQTLSALPSKDQGIVVVCETGYRAAIGMGVLRLLGYKAGSLQGGMAGWRTANLPVVTGPVPQRRSGPAPQVNEPLRAALTYYLTKTLPVHEGIISGAELSKDQEQISTMAEEAIDVFDQGKSFLMVVDGPEEYAKVHLADGAMNFELHGLVDSALKLPPTGGVIFSGACRTPNRFNVEPKLSRFVVLSTSGHRAALGMMSMQLVGFHFVRGLDGDAVAWRAGRPIA
jgi:rhodanese-related sulfurtransferase